MSEKMIIKVIALGSDTRDYKIEDNVGFTNRAFSKSGKSVEERTSGKGFVSFSPRLGLKDSPNVCRFNPERELHFKDKERPADFNCKITCDKCINLKPDLLYDYNIFEGSMRTNQAGVEYLALYRPADENEVITHYLLRFVTNYKNYESVVKTTGKIISEAISESVDGKYKNCEQLIILKNGDTLNTEGREYAFIGERLAWKNKPAKTS